MSWRNSLSIGPHQPWTPNNLHHWIVYITLSSQLIADVWWRSGALWLPSNHPGGCYTLEVVEEIFMNFYEQHWLLSVGVCSFGSTQHSASLSASYTQVESNILLEPAFCLKVRTQMKQICVQISTVDKRVPRSVRTFSSLIYSWPIPTHQFSLWTGEGAIYYMLPPILVKPDVLIFSNCSSGITEESAIPHLSVCARSQTPVTDYSRCDWRGRESMPSLPPKKQGQFCSLGLLATDDCAIVRIWTRSPDDSLNAFHSGALSRRFQALYLKWPLKNRGPSFFIWLQSIKPSIMQSSKWKRARRVWANPK